MDLAPRRSVRSRGAAIARCAWPERERCVVRQSGRDARWRAGAAEASCDGKRIGCGSGIRGGRGTERTSAVEAGSTSHEHRPGGRADMYRRCVGNSDGPTARTLITVRASGTHNNIRACTEGARLSGSELRCLASLAPPLVRCSAHRSTAGIRWPARSSLDGALQPRSQRGEHSRLRFRQGRRGLWRLPARARHRVERVRHRPRDRCLCCCLCLCWLLTCALDRVVA